MVKRFFSKQYKKEGVPRDWRPICGSGGVALTSLPSWREIIMEDARKSFVVATSRTF